MALRRPYISCTSALRHLGCWALCLVCAVTVLCSSPGCGESRPKSSAEEAPAVGRTTGETSGDATATTGTSTDGGATDGASTTGADDLAKLLRMVWDKTFAHKMDSLAMVRHDGDIVEGDTPLVLVCPCGADGFGKGAAKATMAQIGEAAYRDVLAISK